MPTTEPATSIDRAAPGEDGSDNLAHQAFGQMSRAIILKELAPGAEESLGVEPPVALKVHARPKATP